MPDKRTIFLGYAFQFPEVRQAVAAAAEGFADVVCADNALTGKHLLDKIEDMMLDSDVSIFDLSGYNVNVAVEYGLARGLKLGPYILFNEDPKYRPAGIKVPEIFSDLRGIDRVPRSGVQVTLDAGCFSARNDG